MPIITAADEYNIGPAKTSSQEQSLRSDVDSPVNDLNMHATVAEGYSWVVEYYSAILTDDQQLVEYSINVNSTLQTYAKIDNFELKAQDELSYGYVNDSVQSSLTGSAIVPAGTLVPKVNDFFLARIDANRIALFNVTSTRPASIYETKAYEIEYTATLSIDDDVLLDIADKTVKVYSYDKNRLYQNNNALVEDTQLMTYDTVISLCRDSFNEYLAKFYDKISSTFLFKGENITFFDPYLVNHLCKIINASQINHIRDMNHFDICEYPEYDVSTIWDKLLDSNAYIQHLTLGITDSTVLTKHLMHANLRYTDIDYFIAPSDEIDVTNVPVGLGVIKGDDVVYPDLDLSEGYIFNVNLFSDDYDTSVFEQVILDHVAGVTITAETLITLLNEYRSLSNVQKFYYLPILMTIVLNLKV